MGMGDGGMGMGMGMGDGPRPIRHEIREARGGNNGHHSTQG